MRPLDGLRVLEAANYVSGPFAGLLLAQLGADVVKLEDPRGGDSFRKWRDGASSPTFTALNHGKRSVAVDLRDPHGQEIVRSAIPGIDVFLENYRPGVLDRYGLGAVDLRRIEPRLLYCSITGFGPDGPLADAPGYDTVGQARSGLLGLLTDMGDPHPMGISLSDHITGVFAVVGVLAALREREITGVGTHVRTSLLEATAGLLTESFGRYLLDGRVPDRGHRARLAQVYTAVAGDGRPLAVHLSSPEKFWRGLCMAIGRPELADDERFRERADRIEHFEVLREVIGRAAASTDRDTFLAALSAEGVPCAPIQDLAEVVADEQVRHLDLIATTSGDRGSPADHPRAGVSAPGWRDEPLGDAPGLGEDTSATLREWGVDPELLRAALSSGGVGPMAP